MFIEDTLEIEPPSTPAESGPALRDFLADLLAEQQTLDTPAARFGRIRESDPPLEKPRTFRDLIPLSAPAAGEQYAFEVDLDACSGCKACVAACHSLNGLDATESWRDVGLVLSIDRIQPWQQTITSACHHCVEPACALGCPVGAYEKSPLTGIVRHLDDQCIGCSYCILKCPYDVPKFNARLGIVRKCDMCHQRLAVGEAPACVQACPTHAIRIVTVAVAPANAPEPAQAAAAGADCACGGACGCKSKKRRPGRRRADTSAFLGAAPDPSYTQPTTRYVSSRGVPSQARPADAGALHSQPAHPPLVAMLVCTQLAIGLLVAVPLAPARSGGPLAGISDFLTRAPAHAMHLAVLGLFFGGLGASVLHLGKPLRAWRFFLGLRTSWLSREILVFNVAGAVLMSTLLRPDLAALRAAAVATAALGVFCSAMIYIDTRRRSWRPFPTALRMGGTVVVAACALVAPRLAAALLALKLAGEALALRGDSMTARLQRGPLLGVVAARFAIGAAAVALFAAGVPWTALAPLAAGEFVERFLYFRTVDAPKMPGMPAAA